MERRGLVGSVTYPGNVTVRHRAGWPEEPREGRGAAFRRFRQRLLERLPGRRSTIVWLNMALALLLVSGSVGAFVLIRHRDGAPASAVRTAVVGKGTVTATVTGSGNTESSVSTSVSFPTAGTVTEIAVEVGDSVKVGQVLARIDSTSAKQTLTNARAALKTAQAAYTLRVGGQTAVGKQQDQLNVAKAQQAVTVAQTAVTNARAQLASDTTTLETAISNAETQRANDETSLNGAVGNAETQLSNDTSAQNLAVSAAGSAVETARASCTSSSATTSAPTTSAPATTSGGTTATTSGAALAARPTYVMVAWSVRAASTGCTAVTNAEQALASAEQARTNTLTKDQQAVTTAEQNRDATLAKDDQAIKTAQLNKETTLAKDQQAIVTAQQGVVTAQQNLKAAQLTSTANATPYTAADIASARATLTSAQISYEQAEDAYDDTALVAPLAGKVLAVNGKVGQSSSSGGSSSSTSSSGSGGSGTGSGSSSSSSSSGSSSGFVEIANLSKMAVTANIAEADVKNIELGQAATVTFSAGGETADATVTEISPESTTSNNVVMYPVTVSLTSVPEGVKLGATVSVSITTGSADDVLVVPSSAVNTVGNRHTVTVVQGETRQVVEVQVGLAGDSGTEITSGLAEGDTVVVGSSTSTTSNGVPSSGSRMGGGIAGVAGMGGAGR